MKQQIYARRGVKAAGNVSAMQAPGWVSGASSGAADVLNAFTRTGTQLAEIFAREYRERKEGEVRDLVTETQARFEAWKAEYERVNQGRKGLNAILDYSRKYVELGKEAKEKLDAGRYEIFHEQLARELRARGMFAIRDGANWQARQQALWEKSQFEAEKSDYEHFVASNPYDEDGIIFRKNQLLDRARQVNPGQDIGAMVNALEGETMRARFNSMVNMRDFENADRLLQMRGDLVRRGITEKTPVGGWAAAYNNPGCVKTDNDNFAMYGTLAEGLAAIMERAQAYARKGYNTPAKIMSLYAPPDDGNNTGEYVSVICRATGKQPDEALDTSDPAFLKSFTRAIVGHENSMRVSDEDLEAGLNYLQKNGKPKATGKIPVNRPARMRLLSPGISPAEWERMQNTVQAGLKAREQEALAGTSQNIFEQASRLPAGEQMEFVNRQTEHMPGGQREKVREAVFSTLARIQHREDWTRGLKERERKAAEEKRYNDLAGSIGHLPKEAREESITAVAAGNAPENVALRQRLFAFSDEMARQERIAWQNIWQSQMAANLSELADQPEAMQDARLAALVDAWARGTEDQAEMFSFGKAIIERDRKLRDAREDKLIADIAPLTDNMSGAEIKSRLDSMLKAGQLSQKGHERAIKQLLGPAGEENLDNIQALRRAKSLISMGHLADDKSRLEYAEANRLTISQQKELLSFQGYASESWSMVQAALKQKGISNPDIGQISFLMDQLPKDRKPAMQDAAKIVSDFTTKNGWFGSSLMDQMRQEQGPDDDWLPPLEDYEIPELTGILKARGLFPSTHNLKVLKKLRLARQHHFRASENFQK